MPGSRNTSILHFFPKIPPPPPFGGGCHEIYNFLSPYPTDATCQIWLRLAKKMLTYDGTEKSVG